jgi:LysM repeat protein
MLKFKKLKSFVATLSLSVLLAYPVQAATYKVLPNDSLYKIGVLFNTTASTLKSTNNLSSNIIYPGQQIYVQATTYTVKAGDTLYFISKRYGVSLYNLRKANNKWNDYLAIGQKLIIPGTSSVSSQATTSTTASTTASKSVIPYSSADLDLLARLIRAEAENQPYSAKVCVASVVVNRVQSSQFPNTISGVINQKANGYYQFTPVENGTIAKPATATDRQAALEALNGADPTKGSLFFYDDSATSRYLLSKPVSIKIADMVFAY